MNNFKQFFLETIDNQQFSKFIDWAKKTADKVKQYNVDGVKFAVATFEPDFDTLASETSEQFAERNDQVFFLICFADDSGNVYHYIDSEHQATNNDFIHIHDHNLNDKYAIYDTVANVVKNTSDEISNIAANQIADYNH